MKNETYEEVTGRVVSDEDRANEVQRLNSQASSDQSFVAPRAEGEDDGDDDEKPWGEVDTD